MLLLASALGRCGKVRRLPQHEYCENAAPLAAAFGGFGAQFPEVAAGRNYVAFSKASGTMGDASAGTDDFCAIIGPATGCDRAGAGIRSAGRERADFARGQDP